MNSNYLEKDDNFQMCLWNVSIWKWKKKRCGEMNTLWPWNHNYNVFFVLSSELWTLARTILKRYSLMPFYDTEQSLQMDHIQHGNTFSIDFPISLWVMFTNLHWILFSLFTEHPSLLISLCTSVLIVPFSCLLYERFCTDYTLKL